MSFPLKPVCKCENFDFSVKNIIDVEDYVEVVKDDLIYIIVLKNEQDVKRAVPNFEAIKAINTRAIGITAKASNGFDFSSRYFAPKVGLYEDPVCGSMHCRLAYYWRNILKKSTFTAFQSSKRSGILNLKINDETVEISGSAITVCKLNII